MSGFCPEGTEATAQALGAAGLERAYLTHYGALCGGEAVQDAARQVGAGARAFEGMATQAHCLHMKGALLEKHLAEEIGEWARQRARAQAGAEGLETAAALAAGGLARLVGRWQAVGGRMEM